MGYHLAALAVPLLLVSALAGCATTKPVPQNNISIEDLNGVRSRAGSALSDIATSPAISPVKTLKKTPEELVFEAEGEGTCTKYERQIDAEKRAEEDALSRAVKEAGVNVYSGMQDAMAQYGNTNYQFVGKYLNVWSNALVSYEKTGPAACTTTGDITRCTAKIRGQVYYKGDPDPNFEIKAELSKPAYYDGDNVNLKVALTEDAYITVLNCDEDGKVTLLFPNSQARDNFLPAGKELNIPDDLPFQLKAMLPQGRSETGEILHVIATKKLPLVLLNSLKEEKTGAFISYSIGGLKDLVNKLSKFTRSDWTAHVIVYLVKRK